jgi:hypothetical protein
VAGSLGLMPRWCKNLALKLACSFSQWALLAGGSPSATIIAPMVIWQVLSEISISDSMTELTGYCSGTGEALGLVCASPWLR